MQRAKQNGFTLIELIVVMAILTLLATVGYRAMITALNTRQAVTAASERLRELELGLFILTKDLQQIQRSPIPQNTLPFTTTEQTGQLTTGELFRFYRSPDIEMRQGVTEIQYHLNNQKLEQWMIQDNNVFKTPILSNIKHLSLAFYNAKGVASPIWTNSSPPTIIEITIEHQHYGQLILAEALND